MTLEFRPPPYQPRPTAADYSQQWGKSLNDIGDTLIQGAQQKRTLQHQQLMDQIVRAQEGRAKSAFDLENNPLIPPQPNSPMGPQASNPLSSYDLQQNPLYASAGTADNGQAAPASMPVPATSPHIQAWNNHPNLAQFAPQRGNQRTNPEQPYLDILHNPGESPARQKLASAALERITQEEKTPYEIPMLKATLSKNQAEANKANAEASLLSTPGGGYKVQNQLEQQARDLATKIINSRSGDFGIQNGKVSQAIHLRSLLDQYKQTDPRTGETTYNVPNSQYSELAVGLANLLSSGGQAAESTIHSIRQSSALGDINGALTYAGFDPKTLGGSTQSILKNLSDSIDRQGLTSQKLREPVLNQIRQQMPTMLNPLVKERIINSLGVNRYEDYLNGGGQAQPGSGQPQTKPLYANNGKQRIMSTDDGQTWGPAQ